MNLDLNIHSKTHASLKGFRETSSCKLALKELFSMFFSGAKTLDFLLQMPLQSDDVQSFPTDLEGLRVIKVNSFELHASAINSSNCNLDKWTVDSFYFFQHFSVKIVRENLTKHQRKYTGLKEIEVLLSFTKNAELIELYKEAEDDVLWCRFTSSNRS